jgi:hypothetical protein
MLMLGTRCNQEVDERDVHGHAHDGGMDEREATASIAGNSIQHDNGNQDETRRKAYRRFGKSLHHQRCGAAKNVSM